MIKKKSLIGNKNRNKITTSQAEEEIKNSSIFLTQLESPMETVIHSLKIAKSNNVTTILNPAHAAKLEKQVFPLIDYFTPNETEASYYLKEKVESKTEIERAAKSFLKKGVKNIIITLGSKGVYFANSDESYFIEAFKLKNKVLDTTGAGDAFNGAFAYALSTNLNNKDALTFANKVAGISTTKLGAASSMPTLNEVEEY